MVVEVKVRTALTPLLVAAALCALATAALTPVSASAQARGNVQAEQGRSLHDRVFGNRQPATGRYAGDNATPFVLDRSGQRPLLRFEQNFEIWALRAAPAPRGDIIYRNDAGDQVLRVTPDGGMTLYTVNHPGGVPVARVGGAPALRPNAITVGQLSSALLRQSYLASRVVGRTVEVAAPSITPGTEASIAEAATVAVEAVARLARNDAQRGRVSQIRRILIVSGQRPDAALINGTLQIVIQPQQGVAGRPSSARIARNVAR